MQNKISIIFFNFMNMRRLYSVREKQTMKKTTSLVLSSIFIIGVFLASQQAMINHEQELVFHSVTIVMAVMGTIYVLKRRKHHLME